LIVAAVMAAALAKTIKDGENIDDYLNSPISA